VCFKDNTISWFENDGTGAFSTQKVITRNASGAWGVYAADINNDGWLDVLSASYRDNITAWYMNLQNGLFGPRQIISTQTLSARSVVAHDLDGDGDSDVLVASGGE